MNQNDSNSYSIEPIEKTPFSIAYTPGEIWLVSGNNRIVKLENEKEVTETKKRVKKTDWGMIIPIIGIMVEQLAKIKANDN